MPARSFLKISASACLSFVALVTPAASQPAPGELRLAQYQVLEVAPSDESESQATYLWTLAISNGAITVSGDVPAEAFQRYFKVRAQAALDDESVVRDGAPEGFVLNALAALEVSRLLANGRAGLDGEGWYIEGELAAGRTRSDVVSALAEALTPAKQWRIVLVESPVLDPWDESRGDMDGEERTESTTPTDVIPGLVPGNQDDAPADSEPAENPALDPGNESQGDMVGEEGAEQPAQPAYTFQAVKGADGVIALRGNAPASVLQTIIAMDEIPVYIDRIATNPHAPDGFRPTAVTGLRALDLLDTGQVVLRDGTWLLSGNAAIDTVSNAALAMLSSETPDVAWKTLVIAPPALDICREAVSNYMADKAILFPSAGTTPTAASLDLLPGLVEHLAICPDAPIFVEGHTDSDGTTEANLILSIRRAEAVVDALVELGVDPARLYAVGYGASLPIATNATADGKRQNRRIVFSFEDIARPAP
ncbi:OmpA family protein [Pelagibacterium limicola]|uniref:OmpA family protein n=1 Tax=Pelagibacterium limicola TaxID=2791022 RepID=UPI0024843E50|nr:OmpA family protein [Pelagibacterium limicola]